MNENVLGSFFKKDLKTINSLGDEEYNIYKKRFFQYYKDLISQHFSSYEVFKLKQNSLAKLFFKFRAIEANRGFDWVATRLNYGREGTIFVPRNFYVLTETVLSMDCKVNGIFRVRNSMVDVERCVKLLNDCVSKNMSYKEIRKTLLKYFNVIDLTTAFKEIIREFSTTIIPEELIDTMFKISAVEDKEDQLILCHMMFLVLPKTNRHVLEATVYFLYVIHDIATENGTNTRNNMNMEGISTIMMPNLVIRPHNELDLEEVNVLVKFMVVFFKHFGTIIQLDKNIIEM